MTLDVPTGEVTAVVGGDGAGKSTLLRVLAGRVGVQAGEVRTLGKGAIGYQPSTSGVWGGLTVAENLAFVGQSFGMSLRALRVRGGDLLERAGLADARGRLGRDLSGGMCQKLGFVFAIVHAPRLVLLDEPSTGVDPVSRVELWRLIAEAATGDTAVLLATTYLDEAARAATVTALDAGAVIASGTPDEVVASVPGRIVVTGDSGPRTWQRGTVRHRWVPGGTDAGVTPDADAPIDLEDALIALTLARAAPPATRREAREARAGALTRPRQRESLDGSQMVALRAGQRQHATPAARRRARWWPPDAASRVGSAPRSPSTTCPSRCAPARSSG
ncbi:ABC transporter ATP-binding protein [Microbacterium aurum]